MNISELIRLIKFMRDNKGMAKYMNTNDKFNQIINVLEQGLDDENEN